LFPDVVRIGGYLNRGTFAASVRLPRLAAHPDPIVAEHHRWAPACLNQ
jgi:hypothetical protein